jgi:hypothetical protein
MYLHLEKASSASVLKEHLKEFMNLTGLSEVLLESMKSDGTESARNNLSTALRRVIRYMSKVRSRIRNHSKRTNSTSGKRKPVTSNYVRGMGSRNHLVIATSRATFREYLASRGNDNADRGWFFLNWRLARRRGDVVNETFRRETMDGIVGWRGSRTGGWYPDRDLYVQF